MTTEYLVFSDEHKLAIRKICEDALLSQSACNLSGIIHAWSRHLSVLWDIANTYGYGTDWVNEHPINRLFVEQAAYLSKSGIPSDGEVPYFRVTEYCEKMATLGDDAGDYCQSSTLRE